MRSPKHIEAQIEKQPWRKEPDGRYSLCREEFRDSSFYDDMVDLFGQSFRNGSDTARGSIYLGEYRYWRDVPTESLCREKMNPLPLTSRVLTGLLRKMIRVLESMPDGTSISSSELLFSTSDIFFAQNLGLGPSYTVIDGVFYCEAPDCKIKGEIEWEMCDRFNAAAMRHGFILDYSDSAFKILGLPYNIACVYRRKSNLLLKAAEISDSDAVCDTQGNILYKAVEWIPNDGHRLMVLKLAPEGGPVRFETGQTCCQIETLSGAVHIKAHHPLFACVFNEKEPRWIDTGEEKICHGKGGICAESDYVAEDRPWNSHFTVENVGEEEAIVFISRETEFDTDEEEE